MTIPEIAVIIYVLNYNNYNKYINYIQLNKDYKELVIVYNALKALHESVPNVDKTIDELEAYVAVSYPNMKVVQSEAIGIIFESLRKQEISEGVLEQLVDEIQQREVSSRIAIASLEYA